MKAAQDGVKRAYQICSNCVMDTSDAKIVFDENGVCDHCKNFYENIQPNWHTDSQGAQELEHILSTIREKGKGKKYDCVIGLSGGVDSSYLAYCAKVKWGLHPLLLAVDTGWNLKVANDNITRLVEKLRLDIVTVHADWDEMKDLQLAYLKAQIPDVDIQDHVIFAGLYNYAVKHKIKYVVTGANISTECIREPLEWSGMSDIRMLKDIHRRFGQRPLKTLPLCGMFKYRILYEFILGMKRVYPLNYISYQKEEAIQELEKEIGWERYANKHYENVFTRYAQGYYLIEKFGFDTRRPHLSSLILSGQMSRGEALEKLSQLPYDKETMHADHEYIAKRLGITSQELTEIIHGDNNLERRGFKNNKALIRFILKAASLVGFDKRNLR